MRKTFYNFIITGVVTAALAAAVSAGEDDGTFRGKWWNYYDRALAGAEKGDWDNSIADLKKAISMRPRDQRMARTYGMHFIDYFPHRELGIGYIEKGQVDQGISELEQSLREAESAKAFFYLNRARRSQLLKRRGSIRAPVILIAPVTAASRSLSFTVKGKATGEGLIARILINGEPYRFDLASGQISFEKEIQVDEGENVIAVACEDLLGNRAEETVSVSIDREGPGITLADIKSEEKAGGRVFRISGTVNDATGISGVTIGDNVLAVNGRKEYAFDVAVEKKKVGETILVQATDALGNTTEALIHIEKELAAFRRRPQPVLLAFNSDKILGFDKEPPSLRLRESGETPKVFIDRYFVEGEVSDNKKVDKVVINGREITSGKGKKIFFSKMIKLNDGNNKIVVEAFDGSGNRSLTQLAVRREVPTVMQVGSRMALTVLPFDAKQRSGEYGQIAYDFLIGAFVDQKRFNVIERAKLEQVLQEQKLTKAKLSDPAHSIRIGKLMSANAIVATSVKEDQKSIEIVSRVINTETSEVMDVKDVFTEDKGIGVVKELMDGLASKISAGFPLIEGMVINKDSGGVYSDLGSKSKIRKDTGVIVYRKGKEMKHPVTGKSLGFDTVKLGEGYIEDLQEDFSKIKLSEKPVPRDIRVKDLVITK